MTINEERVKERLKEALCNVYKTEIQFAKEVAVQGLIGLTLDKQNILLVELSETFNNNKGCFNEEGKTVISYKPTTTKIDVITKRHAPECNDSNTKRARLNVPGSHTPSISSALESENHVLSKNIFMQEGIAHKHQINSGFEVNENLLLDNHIDVNNQDNQREPVVHNQPQVNEMNIKAEPMSDDEGDAQMIPDVNLAQDAFVLPDAQQKALKMEQNMMPVMDKSPRHKPNLNKSPSDTTGMNMFAKMFDASNPLYSPFQGVHHRFLVEGESTNGEKMYQCDLCNYTTRWPSNLKRHKQKHLEPESRPTLIQQKCERCEYQTPWSSNMKRHMRNVHGENQERAYECPSCKTIQVAREEPTTCKSCFTPFPRSELCSRYVRDVIVESTKAIVNELEQESKIAEALVNTCKEEQAKMSRNAQSTDLIREDRINQKEKPGSLKRNAICISNTDNENVGSHVSSAPETGHKTYYGLSNNMITKTKNQSGGGNLNQLEQLAGNPHLNELEKLTAQAQENTLYDLTDWESGNPLCEVKGGIPMKADSSESHDNSDTINGNMETIKPDAIKTDSLECDNPPATHSHDNLNLKFVNSSHETADR